jgi:hypothetical protein
MLNLNLNLNSSSALAAPEPFVCPSPLVSTSSIMAYYKFDGDYTKTLGVAFFGTISPVNVSLTSGKFGQAAAFNGSSSYFPFGNNNTMEPVGTGGWTYSFWIYLNSQVGDMSVWDKRVPGTSGMRILLRTSINAILITNNVQNMAILGIPWTTNTWTHVCIRQNAGTNNWEAFVNGTSYGTVTRTAYSASGQNLTVGYQPANNSSYVDGDVDEWVLYDRALTNTEITDLAAGTCPLTTP